MVTTNKNYVYDLQKDILAIKISANFLSQQKKTTKFSRLKITARTFEMKFYFVYQEILLFGGD